MTPNLLLRLLFILSLISPAGLSAKGNATMEQIGENPGLYFIENLGQVTDQYFNPRTDIDLKLPGRGGVTVFIGSGHMHYQWVKPGPILQEPAGTNGDPIVAPPIEMYRMDVELLGANPHADIIKEQQQAFYERYYLPTVSEAGAQAHTYRRIIYKEIYPNIDWVFYFNESGLLEHDFVVRPGGKVSDIKMRYSGSSDLSINEDGSLTAVTPFGSVTESAPVSFLEGSKQAVSSHFSLEGDVLSFSTAPYSGTLVIDPTLEWGSYFGDIESDGINKIATSSGYVYASGGTNSTANIATVGAHQTTFAGGDFHPNGVDAFIAKFAIGGTCQWATYYGGSGVDVGLAVTLDTFGSVYLAGQTNSTTGIATTGTHQQSLGGTQGFDDAFIVKFDSTGQRIWGTYFGGEGQDGHQSMDIDCDQNNRIFLVGNTQSINGIATVGAYQTSKAGPSPTDGFLAYFNVEGSVIWATYYGGENEDYLNGIIIDTTGYLYVAGSTASSTGIASTGTHMPSYAGGLNDGFIVKFDSSGQREWGSYFGGNASDVILSLNCGQAGDVLIAGTTNSTFGIASANAFQVSFGGSQDVFLAKFSSTGQMDWGTYYGGASNETFPSVFFGPDNKIYLSGTTNSIANIATADGINPNLYGNVYDAFLAVFSLQGARNWATYLGGNFNDQAKSIAGDKIGNLYVAGRSNSSVDLATAGSHQTVLGGGYDGFILRLNTCELLAAPNAITGPTTICEGESVSYYADMVPGATSYQWTLPNGWTGASDADSITVIIGEQSGDILVTGVNHCGPGDTMTLSITVSPAPEPGILRDNHILSVNQTFNAYQWNKDGQPISGANSPTYLVTENGAYTVTVTDGNGCEGTSAIETIDDVTGIYDLTGKFNLKLYPNPAGSWITIESNSQLLLRLVDIIGRTWLEREIEVGKTTLDIADLPTGVYQTLLYDRNNQFVGSEKMEKATR